MVSYLGSIRATVEKAGYSKLAAFTAARMLDKTMANGSAPAPKLDLSKRLQSTYNFVHNGPDYCVKINKALLFAGKDASNALHRAPVEALNMWVRELEALSGINGLFYLCTKTLRDNINAQVDEKPRNPFADTMKMFLSIFGPAGAGKSHAMNAIFHMLGLPAGEQALAVSSESNRAYACENEDGSDGSGTTQISEEGLGGGVGGFEDGNVNAMKTVGADAFENAHQRADWKVNPLTGTRVAIKVETRVAVVAKFIISNTDPIGQLLSSGKAGDEDLAAIEDRFLVVDFQTPLGCRAAGLGKSIFWNSVEPTACSAEKKKQGDALRLAIDLLQMTPTQLQNATLSHEFAPRVFNYGFASIVEIAQKAVFEVTGLRMSQRQLANTKDVIRYLHIASSHFCMVAQKAAANVDDAEVQEVLVPVKSMLENLTQHSFKMMERGIGVHIVAWGFVHYAMNFAVPIYDI
jgi:hypothetical protein